VSSPEALKRALLAAKSIGHTAPASGGVTAAHIIGVFEKLGNRRRGDAEGQARRRRARRARQACWCPAARPRSGCNWRPS